MVQFGVHVGAQNATVEELRTLWKWLDEVGSDWISLWDHLYEAPPAGGTQPHFEAFSMLGALAVDTHKARIGCLVFCSQYRNRRMAKVVLICCHFNNRYIEISLIITQTNR